MTSNSKLPERRHTDKKGVQKDEEESEHNVKKKCMVDLPLKTFLCWFPWIKGVNFKKAFTDDENFRFGQYLQDILVKMGVEQD